MPDTCENCRAVIGDLEVPFLHGDHVVCAACHAKLNPDALTQLAAAIPAPIAPLAYSVARKDRGLSPVLVGAAAIAVGAGVLLLLFGGGTSATPPPAPATLVVSAHAKPASPAPLLHTSAMAIAGTFSVNPVAANTEYRGHRMVVDGRIAAIQADFFNDPTIVLVALPGHYVRCDFSGSMAKSIAKLLPGQTVAIEGQCDGMIDGDVLFSHCEGGGDE